MNELEHKTSELEKSTAENLAEKERVIAVQNQRIEFQTKEIHDSEKKLKAYEKDLEEEKLLTKTFQETVDHLAVEINKLKQNNENLLSIKKSTNENLPELRFSFSSNPDEMLSARRITSERKSVSSTTINTETKQIHYKENLDGFQQEFTNEENSKKLKSKIGSLEEHLKELRLEFISQRKSSDVQIQNIKKEFMHSLEKNEDLINDLKSNNFRSIIWYMFN